MDDSEHFEHSDVLQPALAGYTGYLLTRAFARARVIGKAAMPPGRRPQEMGVLAALGEWGPISQRKMSDRLGVNRTIMVKIVDMLEADGLVRRERDPADRRSYAVTLTDKGTAALALMHQAAGTGEAEITERLTRAEHRRLNDLLRRLLPDAANPPAQLLDRTGFLIANTHVRERERASEALRGLDLELRQFGALSVLAGIQPCSQQRLAADMGVTGPAIVGLVDTLQTSGLIERTRNPDDRREHVLRVTSKGRDRLAAARRAVDDIQGSLADRLGPGGVDELNALLIKIA
jgi:DNA-binding MarR family transcriptional regulator